MPRPARAVRATMALALTIWAEACMAHRPLPADMTVPRGTRVRVSAPVPFALTGPPDTLGTARLRSVTAVEGKVRRLAGDTIVLERSFGVPTSADGSRFREEREVVTLMRTAGMQVTVKKVDWLRTTVLVGGIAVVVIGFAAYAASQMEFGFPNELSLSR